MTTADPLLDWLYSLQGPSLKWDIQTARSFLAACGHPERRFRSVHIAGTNGKGSVAATIHSIAHASGLRSGLYTSPHLVRPEERVRIGDEEISSLEFRRQIDRLRLVAAGSLARGALTRHPSFFEMLTALAFTAFAERNVELGVVETGLGGRLDATNVIVPELSVITTIGRDHLKTLGPTLAHVAREKAGIIKPGIPILTGFIGLGALREIAVTARRAGAPLYLGAEELGIRQGRGGTFSISTPERCYRNLSFALCGRHQLRNAALAVRAAEILRARGLPLDLHAVAEGLAAVRWPGRMERLPGPPPILLDAAHNDDGARALRQYFSETDRSGRGTRVAVFGMTEGRSADHFLRPLRDRIDALVITRPAIDKAVPPESILRTVDGWFSPAVVCETVPDALRCAAGLAGPGGEIVVTGSLYLVGDARKMLLNLDGPGHPPRETLLPPARVPAIVQAR